MNRLTEKKEHGEWSLKGVDWQQLYVGRTITQEVKEKLLAALFKLLHYENSGLRPDEVRELAENNGWILASEKMPAKDGRYLVTFKKDYRNSRRDKKMQEKALVAHIELHKEVVKTPGYSVTRAARSL